MTPGPPRGPRPAWLALLLGACSSGPPAAPGTPPAGSLGARAPGHREDPDAVARPASSEPSGSPSSGSPSSGSPSSGSAPVGRTSVGSVSSAGRPGDAGAPGGGACPGDMVASAGVCIDRFEAPNVEGQRPIVMVDAHEAEAWCAARGKRLCTEDEWIGGCGGAQRRRFPYGDSHREGACHDDGRWLAPSWGKLARWPAPEARAELARLDQREPSGSRPGCVSPDGVRDATGSVAEWVRRSRPHEPAHSHVSMGCYWGKCFRPPHTPTCDYANYNHPAGWRSYEIGFRCCAVRRGGSNNPLE